MQQMLQDIDIPSLGRYHTVKNLPQRIEMRRTCHASSLACSEAGTTSCKVRRDSRNMRPHIYLFAAALAFLIGLFDMQPMRAQGLYGSLVGNITDPSNAGIPGARVKITHVETNLVRETLSNTD